MRRGPRDRCARGRLAPGRSRARRGPRRQTASRPEVERARPARPVCSANGHRTRQNASAWRMTDRGRRAPRGRPFERRSVDGRRETTRIWYSPQSAPLAPIDLGNPPDAFGATPSPERAPGPGARRRTSTVFQDICEYPGLRTSSSAGGPAPRSRLSPIITRVRLVGTRTLLLCGGALSDSIVWQLQSVRGRFCTCGKFDPLLSGAPREREREREGGVTCSGGDERRRLAVGLQAHLGLLDPRRTRKEEVARDRTSRRSDRGGGLSNAVAISKSIALGKSWALAHKRH